MYLTEIKDKEEICIILKECWLIANPNSKAIVPNIEGDILEASLNKYSDPDNVILEEEIYMPIKDIYLNGVLENII